jgi:hypothetical protein
MKEHEEDEMRQDVREILQGCKTMTSLFNRVIFAEESQFSEYEKCRLHSAIKGLTVAMMDYRHNILPDYPY